MRTRSTRSGMEAEEKRTSTIPGSPVLYISRSRLPSRVRVWESLAFAGGDVELELPEAGIDRPLLIGELLQIAAGAGQLAIGALDFGERLLPPAEPLRPARSRSSCGLATGAPSAGHRCPRRFVGRGRCAGGLAAGLGAGLEVGFGSPSAECGCSSRRRLLRGLLELRRCPGRERRALRDPESGFGVCGQAPRMSAATKRQPRAIRFIRRLTPCA